MLSNDEPFDAYMTARGSPSGGLSHTAVAQNTLTPECSGMELSNQGATVEGSRKFGQFTRMIDESDGHPSSAHIDSTSSRSAPSSVETYVVVALVGAIDNNLEGAKIIERVDAQEVQAMREARAVGMKGSEHVNTAEPPRQDRSDYRADVDGLRAVAVTAVMIYHMEHGYLPGGFVGVDIFFCISGFVVSGSLLRSPARDFKTFLLTFYARRVKRLVPALLLFVLATSTCISVLVRPEAGVLQEHYTSGQLALIGWSNNFFAGRANSYWQQGIKSLEYNPFTHTYMHSC
jgi:hypothetical protein